MRSRAEFVQPLSAVTLREHPLPCQAGRVNPASFREFRHSWRGALPKGKASGEVLLCRERSRAVQSQTKLLLGVGAAVFCPAAASSHNDLYSPRGLLFLCLRSPKFKLLSWKLHLTFKKRAEGSGRALEGRGQRGQEISQSLSRDTSRAT